MTRTVPRPHQSDSTPARVHRVSRLTCWLGIALVGATMIAPLSLSAENAREAQIKAREKAFMEAMSGTTLTGYFSVIGEEKDGPPNSDSYQIAKVTKGGNFFLFHAKFGKAQLPPLPLKVVWAGKKPVITMDKIVIPGFGTFSTHLLIDGNMYAGTWSHGETVGHMWGTIAKTNKSGKGKKSAK